MADKVAVASLGRARTWADSINAGSAKLGVVLLAAGMEADTTLIQRMTLAEVLGVAQNKEAAWSGGTAYQRLIYSAVTVTVNAANARIDLDVADPFWLAAASQATKYDLGKVGFFYTPSAGSANSSWLPFSWTDFPVTADGSKLQPELDAAGFYRHSVA